MPELFCGMRKFKDLKIWACGMEITRNCFKITSNFSNLQKFDLGSQINRSAVSIPSNIAEGVSRSSLKEFKRFIEYALGSAFELETQLLICRDITSGPRN